MGEKMNINVRCPKTLYKDFRRMYIDLGYRCGSDMVVDALQTFIDNERSKVSKEQTTELQQA